MSALFGMLVKIITPFIPVMKQNFLQCIFMQHQTRDKIKNVDWKPDILDNNIQGSNFDFAKLPTARQWTLCCRLNLNQPGFQSWHCILS